MLKENPHNPTLVCTNTYQNILKYGRMSGKFLQQTNDDCDDDDDDDINKRTNQQNDNSTWKLENKISLNA